MQHKPLKDVTEFLDAGGTADELNRAAMTAKLLTAADVADASDATSTSDAEPALKLMTAAALVDSGIELSDPIVDGVFRIGEIVNVISGSKSFKTYLILALGLSIAAGRKVLGFETRRVRVLLLDNELHCGTLRHRVKAVASALGIDLHELADYFHIVSLRGQLRDIRQMRSFFAGIKPGYYGLIVLDSWYRMIPGDVDENSNSAMTQLYNLLDTYAAMLKAAFLLVHHSTKGRQGDKAITDVGAGAGAQSRAADCHLILRAHSQDGCAVLESAIRSFAPMPAVGLRWMYPVWTLADDIDTTDVKREKSGRRKAAAANIPAEPAQTWTAQTFVAAFVTGDARSTASILTLADAKGLSERKASRLLAVAVENGLAHEWTYANRRLPHRFSTIPQPVTEANSPPENGAVRSRARTPRTPHGRVNAPRGTENVRDETGEN